MLDQLYPNMVHARLRGERVAVVSWGPLPDGVESGIRDAIHKSGGRLDSVSSFDTPLPALKRVLGRNTFAAVTSDQGTLEEFGRSLADGLIGSGTLGTRLRNAFPDDYAGRFARADAIVFYNAPPPDDGGDEQGVKER